MAKWKVNSFVLDKEKKSLWQIILIRTFNGKKLYTLRSLELDKHGHGYRNFYSEKMESRCTPINLKKAENILKLLYSDQK